MLRAVVAACVLLLAGCEHGLLEPIPLVQPDLGGSLRIPLTAVDADGARYHLEQLTLEIGGPVMLTLATGATREPSLLTSLPEGIYTLFVRPDFRVVRRAADGTEQVVEAALAGANPLHFGVGARETATLKLGLTVDGQPLNFGGGTPVRVTRAH
ncbi:MAG: hypothetical protein ABW252_16105 [Polyangiales bacterium]